MKKVVLNKVEHVALEGYSAVSRFLALSCAKSVPLNTRS